jgi:hypothetical protein
MSLIFPHKQEMFFNINFGKGGVIVLTVHCGKVCLGHHSRKYYRGRSHAVIMGGGGG